jgi:hypothetical protein
MVGMNPQALGKLARTYFHKTLTDLIRERILKHAKWQLLHTLRPGVPAASLQKFTLAYCTQGQPYLPFPVTLYLSPGLRSP